MSDSDNNSANNDNSKDVNHSDCLHLPNPEFIAALESTVVDAFRRQSTPVPPTVVVKRRRMRTLAALAVGLLIGGVAGIAPAQMRNARQRVELSVNQAMLKGLAQLRLQLAQEKYQLLKKSVESGATDPSMLKFAQNEVLAEVDIIKGIDIDSEEIRATAAAPRDEL
ncbi:MAG: hypothetical protein ABJC26_03095 [Gemmatimonadaceae bacterium]